MLIKVEVENIGTNSTVVACFGLGSLKTCCFHYMDTGLCITITLSYHASHYNTLNGHITYGCENEESDDDEEASTDNVPKSCFQERPFDEIPTSAGLETFSLDYMKRTLSKFTNVNETLFQLSGESCNIENCTTLNFLKCAHCQLHLCLSHFFIDFHFHDDDEMSQSKMIIVMKLHVQIRPCTTDFIQNSE